MIVGVTLSSRCLTFRPVSMWIIAIDKKSLRWKLFQFKAISQARQPQISSAFWTIEGRWMPCGRSRVWKKAFLMKWLLLWISNRWSFWQFTLLVQVLLFYLWSPSPTIHNFVLLKIGSWFWSRYQSFFFGKGLAKSIQLPLTMLEPLAMPQKQSQELLFFCHKKTGPKAFKRPWPGNL